MLLGSQVSLDTINFSLALLVERRQLSTTHCHCHCNSTELFRQIKTSLKLQTMDIQVVKTNILKLIILLSFMLKVLQFNR